MWPAQYLLIKDFITVLTDHVPPQAWDQNLCLGCGNPQAPGGTKHILCPCADVLLKALAWVSYPVQLRFIRMGPQHKTTGDSGVDHFRISLSSFLKWNVWSEVNSAYPGFIYLFIHVLPSTALLNRCWLYLHVEVSYLPNSQYFLYPSNTLSDLDVFIILLLLFRCLFRLLSFPDGPCLCSSHVLWSMLPWAD